MPLIHFAFGSLHREHQLDEQLENFIRHILEPMKFKAFACPEFIPTLPPEDALVFNANIDPNKPSALTYETSQIQRMPIMLWEDVWMTSFVKIPLIKIGSWVPADHYGKLGIAMTDKFRTRIGARPVGYYQYEKLHNDPLTLTHIQAAVEHRHEDPLVRAQLLHFRKPERMTPAFRIACKQGRLERTHGGDRAASTTYDRYPIGWKFSDEQEWRVIADEFAPDIGFSCDEVLCLIAHNTRQAEALRDYMTGRCGRSIPVHVPNS